MALYELRHALLQTESEAELRAIIAHAMFAPASLDDLFEAWTLLRFVELHFQSGWQLESARLVGVKAKNRPQFLLKRGNETSEIFYQIVPGNLVASSAYKVLFSDYDLDVSVRRPDIVANIATSGFNGPLIVEVKRSTDRSYIADAAYKVLGYVSDYEKSFGAAKPKAVLVVAGGIEAPEFFRPNSDIWIVPEARFRTLRLPY